jgi:calcium-dependent protein kinase
MRDMVGTPYYVAPEILKGKYVSKCDLWSCGVLMYMMLSGYIPFNGDTAEEVYDKVLEGRYSLKQKEWKKVSEQGKDLLSHLLIKDYKRYTAEETLKHEWFSNCKSFKDDADKDPLDPNMLQNLTVYKGSSKLKQAALNLLVKMLPTKEIDTLKKQFEIIDSDKSGIIDANELKIAMKNN